MVTTRQCKSAQGALGKTGRWESNSQQSDCATYLRASYKKLSEDIVSRTDWDGLYLQGHKVIPVKSMRHTRNVNSYAQNLLSVLKMQIKLLEKNKTRMANWLPCWSLEEEITITNQSKRKVHSRYLPLEVDAAGWDAKGSETEKHPPEPRNMQEAVPAGNRNRSIMTLAQKKYNI